MAEIFYWDAVRRAHDEEMDNDPLVFAMGEDIGLPGGTYKATQGLFDKYGEERVMDTPISENSYTGIGVGASMIGCRPIVEIMSVNFALLATDQIINAAAKIRYMSGGQVGCPLVVRSPGGVAHQLGAQHSGRLEKLFAGTSGLRVVTPAFPVDAYGMLKTAVRCDDPVVILEHEAIYNLKGEVPDEEYFAPLEGARVVREGTDVTLVGYLMSTHWNLAAADKLAEQGISAEVIDLRSLKPIDGATLRASLAKTHKAVICTEDEAPVGMSAEIMAVLNEECFFELDAPPVRVTAEDVPMPYNHELEKAALPDADKIVTATQKLLGH
ncbi:alpha-ketoacid dehydrogenase subunit beta [Thiohalorhabdus methylotrophus]|uniref:Alpha-ketoacid dehydrogenase subunit beta n=1 Tax=Thiohalorhabdus methylotrophus TaxID=3242694 RepID=A0ABV4TW38_9GAMM